MFFIDFETVRLRRGAWLFYIQYLACVAVSHFPLITNRCLAESLKHVLIILSFYEVITGSYLIMFVIFDTFLGLLYIEFIIIDNLV